LGVTIPRGCNSGSEREGEKKSCQRGKNGGKKKISRRKKEKKKQLLKTPNRVKGLMKECHEKERGSKKVKGGIQPSTEIVSRSKAPHGVPLKTDMGLTSCLKGGM